VGLGLGLSDPWVSDLMVVGVGIILYMCIVFAPDLYRDWLEHGFSFTLIGDLTGV
jgi:uncharacterized membrane protein YraQ (UPF0718 family)